MDNNSNLPIKVENNKIINQIAKKIPRFAKFTGYSLATLLLGVGGVGIALNTIPIMTIPAILLAAKTGQKALNNSLYTEYKDLAFVTKKNGNDITIAQDTTNIKILSKLKGLNDIQKAGFMQLQALVGLSKYEPRDRKGIQNNFQTITHSVNIKTFRTLEKLGYIENLQEEYYKKSRFVLEKLVFGNTKNLFEKKDFYKISFNRTDKVVDLEDENLKKHFGMVFNEKRGLYSKIKYKIINKNGELTIDFKNSKNNKNQEIANNQAITSNQEKANSFKKSLKGDNSNKKEKSTIINNKEKTKENNDELEL